MSEKKTYALFGILDHNGKRYQPGDSVELTEQEAAPFTYMLAEQGEAQDEDQTPPQDPPADPQAELEANKAARAKELDKLTVDKLKEHAETAKIDLGEASLKAQIIDAIVNAEFAPAPAETND